MRLVVAHKPLKRILRCTQCVLFACALSLLAYCGFVLLEARNFERVERLKLETLMQDQVALSDLPPVQLSIANGDLIGSLEISRLGLSAIVDEGTATATLRHAVGHIAGTALPGRSGNIGIAGHRDTYFRPLRNVQKDDIITLTTATGEYHYRVVFTKIVGPNDVAVLDPTGSEILTLVTCYPFYFVGPAPDRFIVRAERVT